MAKTSKKKATASKTLDIAEKASDSSARNDALERAIAQIEKQYGVGSIMKMDESNRRIEEYQHGGVVAGWMGVRAFRAAG